ncbi:MAG: PfkB family carbohydrate kinase [Armatimonadota bacterium]
MILVFAPNPALERIALVDPYQAAEPQRPMRVGTYAGGAGLRAASVIRLLGGEVLALAFAGGRLGVLLQECLEKQAVPHLLTPTQAGTRGDFLVLDREKGVINAIPEHAPAYTEEEAGKLLRAVEEHIRSASMLLIADGQDEADPDLFTRAIQLAKERQVPILADLCGGALKTAVENGVWLLRVNLKSLQKQTERSLQHDSAIIEEAQGFLACGVGNVVITLGEEGALLVNPSGAWRVKPPVVSHFNPTGSGETLSGALAVQWERSGDIIEAVRYGCAAAAVNVTYDEPGYATPSEVKILLPNTTAVPITIR